MLHAGADFDAVLPRIRPPGDWRTPVFRQVFTYWPEGLDIGDERTQLGFGRTVPVYHSPSRSAPPFPWPAEMAYTEFCELWMAAMTDRLGEITRPAGELHTDPVAVRLACSAQRTVERAVRMLHAETVCLTGNAAVCPAGGVALNCVANGQLPEPVYIPPFPHDAGVAVGAAWSLCAPKHPALLESPYLGAGPRLGDELDTLRSAGFEVAGLHPGKVLDLLTAGRVGAIVEGRGPGRDRDAGARPPVHHRRPAAGGRPGPGQDPAVPGEVTPVRPGDDARLRRHAAARPGHQSTRALCRACRAAAG